MGARKDKSLSLPEAARLVPTGARIALGGFGMYERPMAFARELARHKVRGLTVIGHVNGIEVDLLAGAGALKTVETSYVGLERFGLAPNFSRAVERGSVEYVAFSEQTAFDRFRASQAGLTFWPAIGIAGTDIPKGNAQIAEAVCPFTKQTFYAVSPANADVVVIHAARGDRFGNVALPDERQLPHSLDVILAQGCDTVIVTVEKLVEPEELRRTPQLVEIPGFQVTAIVEAPWGAHPTSVLGAYDADDESIGEYLKQSAEGRMEETSCTSEAEYRRLRPSPGWIARTGGLPP